jgi:putative hydrolase of the HAD superfamily
MPFPTINLTQFKGLLIDLDNTLYQYDPIHLVAQQAAKNALVDRLNTTEIAFDEAYSYARKQVHNDLYGQASSHSRLLYGQKLTEYILGKTHFEGSLLFEQVYWDTFLSHLTLLPEALLLLENAKALNVKVCIVTDLTTAIQLRKIIKLQIQPYIDFIVSSEEAGVEKPDARMFNLALAKLGLQAEDCIMVGDHVEKDIAGAEKLGMKTALVTWD